MIGIESKFITLNNKKYERSIAVLHRRGKSPGFFWLGGYCSTMVGTKAVSLDKWCYYNGYACCRYDYSGHGESGGSLHKGTISFWLEEALEVFNRFTQGPQILVGSSMGAWIAVRLMQQLNYIGLSSRIHGLLLIAPAPDFTERLLWLNMNNEQKEQLATKNILKYPSRYSDEPYIYTRALFDDGKHHLVMNGIIESKCPVHIIQGMQDKDVPPEHAADFASCFACNQINLTYVKNGDHRLSTEQDIDLMLKILTSMTTTVTGK